MLGTDPQMEGSFQLHDTGDRGRPVVCKESTAHHHHRGPAKHSTAHTAQHSTVPNARCHFFLRPGGCRVPVSSWWWCALLVSWSALLCSTLLCLSDLSDLGLSVSISSTLLVLVSLPLVRSWPVLSSPVQSTWQSSAIPSSRLFWFGLFLSKPPHLPSLTFFHSPLKTRP